MYLIREVRAYEPQIEQLPEELQGVLNTRDLIALNEGASYFANLTWPGAPKWWHRVRAKCEGDLFILHFLASGDEAYRPYFRMDMGEGFAISLPRDSPLRPDLPLFLKSYYEQVGAYNHHDFQIPFDILPGDSLKPLSGLSLGLAQDETTNPDHVIPFLHAFDRRHLCYLPDGSGAWLQNGYLKGVSQLEREVERCFATHWKKVGF